MALGTILIMSIIFALFVIFALLIFFLQCCINNSARMRPSGGMLAASGGTKDKGVDPELLRSLPVTVYRRAEEPKGSAAEDVGVECAVCLSELQDGEAARFLPRCGHGFHAQCVDTWLASHTTCPLCRVTVAKPDAPRTASTSLPPVAPEPANYGANVPASVLLGVSGQATLAAVTVTADSGRRRPSALATAAALVIDIPDSRTPATPRDAAKTPGSARLRSLKRLWSFGKQGPSGSAPSCYWGRGSGSGTADTERDVGNASSRRCRIIAGNASATPRAPV
jgi:E3 ubiquitin-protein ligase EL5